MTNPFFTSTTISTISDTPEAILQNLIAKGKITATGIRQFTLGQAKEIPTMRDTGTKIDKAAPTGSVAEVLPSYEQLLANELADGGISLDPEPVYDESSDPADGLTASDAAAMGISADDFADLFQSTDEKKATTSSISNQGDKGKNIPSVPKLDFPNVLGSVEAGASALTSAAKAALISAITGYVTGYVASQLAPLQMQLSSVASAVPAGAGRIAQIPGKIMSIKAKISSTKQKIQTVKNKATAIRNARKTISKQVTDKAQEAKSKVAEKQRLVSSKTIASANKTLESAGDSAAKARRTTIRKFNKTGSSISIDTKRITRAGITARAKTAQELLNSIQTAPNASGLISLVSPTDQSVERQRAVDMYYRNPDSLSMAISLYTASGGTETDFRLEAGI